MRFNSRWKLIQSWEQLSNFLDHNPSYGLVETNDKERRYYVRSADDEIGQSVDGRSVRVLVAIGKARWYGAMTAKGE